MADAPVCLRVGASLYGQFQAVIDTAVASAPTSSFGHVVACITSTTSHEQPLASSPSLSISPPCTWFTDASCTQPVLPLGTSTSWYVLSTRSSQSNKHAPWLASVASQLHSPSSGSRRQLQAGSDNVKCLPVPHRNGGGLMGFGRYFIGLNDHRTIFCEFDYWLTESFTDPNGCLFYRDSACTDLADVVTSPQFQEFYPYSSPWTKIAYYELKDVAATTTTPSSSNPPTTTAAAATLPQTTPPPSTAVPSPQTQPPQPPPSSSATPVATSSPTTSSPETSSPVTSYPQSIHDPPSTGPSPSPPPATTSVPVTTTSSSSTSTSTTTTTAWPTTSSPTSPPHSSTVLPHAYDMSTTTIEPTTSVVPVAAPTLFVNVSMSWKCCYSNVHFLYTPAKMDLTTRLEACLLAGTDSDCRFFPSEAECSAFLRQQPACVLDMTCSVRVRLVTPLDVSNDHHSVLPLATNAAVPPNSTPFDHVNWTWNVVVWVLMGCFAVSFLAVILVYHRRRLRQLFTNKSNQSEGSDDDDDDGGTHVVLYTDRTSAPHRPCNHQDLTTITSTTTTTSTAPSFPPDDPPPLVVCAQLAEQPLDFGDLPLWRLDETHLLMTTVLSIGLHGLVAKGTYKGRRVAIKKLLPPRHPQSTTQSVQLFLDEIKLLSELDSPYIVSLVGVCWDQPRDVVVVMDYMSRGDLRTFLQQRLEFPWTQKIDCAGDVCRGLVYLHSMEVVHRDLKSRNVLLNANMVAKLSDFGLARHVDDYELTLGNVVGSFRYAAPEVLRGELYTEAADMYALGMLLWELDTHEVPFSAMQRQLKCTAMDVYKYMLAHADEWLHVTELCPAKVVDVIKMCTQADPKQRPTAVVLASVLDRLNVAS